MNKKRLPLKTRIAKMAPASIVGMYRKNNLRLRSLFNRTIFLKQLEKRLGKKSKIYIACRNAIKIPSTKAVFEHCIVGDLYGIKKFVKEGDTIVDVGASVGLVSVFAATEAKNSTIYAFEPARESFALLRKNIEDTALSNIIPVKKALGESKGKKKMHYTEQAPGSSYLDGAEIDRVRVYAKGLKKITEEVEMTTLDSFAREQGIKVDFLKIDAEGYEPRVIEGARQILRGQEPTIAVSVYHSEEHPTSIFRKIKSINPKYKLVEKRKAGDEEVFILATR